MKSFYFLIISFLILFPIDLNAQPEEIDPGWQWGRLSNTIHSNGSEVTRADFENHIITLFFYTNSIQIEDTSFYHEGYSVDRSIALVKRNPEGDFLKAVDIYTVPGEYLFDATLETDRESNIYIYGSCTDSLFVNNQLILPVYPNHMPDLYLIKFNNDLEIQWFKVLAGVYQDDCRGIDISDDLFIYLSMKDYHYYDISDGDEQEFNCSHNDLRATNNTLMKLDPEGNLIWQFDMINDQEGTLDIYNTIVGKDGFIYITGEASHDLIIQGDTIINPDIPGYSSEQFIIQFDSEGKHHNAFFNPYRGFFTIYDWFDADTEGNFYISGRATDTLKFENDTINVNADSSFSFVARMNPSFEPDWIRGAMTHYNTYATMQFELNDYGVNFAFQGKSSFYFLNRRYAYNAIGQVFSGLFSYTGDLVDLQITDASIGATLNSFHADNCGNTLIEGLLRGTAHFSNDTISTDGSSQHFLAKNDRIQVIQVEMPADTSGCDYIILYAPEEFSYYRWNGEMTNQYWYLAEESMQIHLEVADENGCWSEAETMVTIWPAVIFSLGNDTSILLTDTLHLKAEPGNLSYLWSTGDITNELNIPANQLQIGPNQIWLEIADEHCSSADTINITVIDNSALNEKGNVPAMLMPNPARNYFKIISSDNILPDWITITDIGGIVVLDQRPYQSVINISGLKQGLFIVELRFHDEVIRRKLMVN